MGAEQSLETSPHSLLPLLKTPLLQGILFPLVPHSCSPNDVGALPKLISRASDPSSNLYWGHPEPFLSLGLLHPISLCYLFSLSISLLSS